MQAGCGTGVGRAHGHAPRQNSPCKPPIRHTPRKNSPSTAKFGRFGLFSERWAKNIALSTQALEAGRIFSRRPPHTSHTAHTHGTKLSGHTACKASTGTKLSRHCPMGRPPPKSHAIPSAPEPTTTQNVGISMIEFQSWKYSSGNCMRNCRASRKTAHKNPPPTGGRGATPRPRLVCISCISANASDYQARTERS